MTMHQNPKPFAYSKQEVIEFRDQEHTPFNKRSGECDSVCAVQIRAPLKSDWVNFNVEEITTTKNYDPDKKDRTQSRTISFTLTREQFAAVVAHVNRTKD